MTGFIEPHALHELWFHTGTACNLACPFCLEGSKPGDGRLDRIALADARPLIDEAVGFGVRQFSFTGGEPFVVRDFVNVLGYAASHRPCLVLTNATDPVLGRLHEIETLRAARNPISFRVSIDHPDAQRHDEGRGPGSFRKALEGIRELRDRGFQVSIARQMLADEDKPAVESAYRKLLEGSGLSADLRLIAFPDLDLPGATRETPEITEDCMTRYHSEETRREFMCAFSKMVIKIGGRMRVYACTLVDDDPRYDLGGTLAEAMSRKITLNHHRCYACFKFGSSCSELSS